MKRLSTTVRSERISREFMLPYAPLMSLFVILIPFLIQAAVFSKTAILNLYLPTTRPKAVDQLSTEQTVVPTIVIKRNGFLVQIGGKGKYTIPLRKGEYDFGSLQERLLTIRQDYPKGQSAVIFVEPDISYGLVVTTMDTCREYTKKVEDQFITEPLYPMISLGEYRPRPNK